MPPRNLTPKDADLVSDVIATFLHGRNGCYPSSHSDMQVSMIAVLKMFEIKRRLEPYNPYPEERTI